MSDIATKLTTIADNTPAVADAVNSAKATASGAVVRVDDVLDVEHRLGVKLKSKNLIPLDSLSATSTINGITFTNNGDGTFTLNGTATAEAVYGFVIAQNSFPVYKGKTYAFSGGISKEIWLQAKYVENDSFYAPDEGKGNSFTADDNYSFRANIRVKAGTVCENVIVKPQLEEGTTATEYAPYNVELLGTEVRVLGKNLFNKSQPQYSGAYCNSAIIDGDLVVTTTSASQYISANFIIPNGTSLVGKTIAICGEWEESSNNKGALRLGWISADNIHAMAGSVVAATESGVSKGSTITPKPDNASELCLWIYGNYSGTGENSATVSYRNIQVEVDSATAYEPYKSPQTATADSSGKAAGLTSVSPTMTLIADNNAVALECTYFPQAAADTYAKYQELKKALQEAKK